MDPVVVFITALYHVMRFVPIALGLPPQWTHGRIATVRFFTQEIIDIHVVPLSVQLEAIVEYDPLQFHLYGSRVDRNVEGSHNRSIGRRR